MKCGIIRRLVLMKWKLDVHEMLMECPQWYIVEI